MQTPPSPPPPPLGPHDYPPSVDCNVVKHQFVYVSLHPQWIDRRMFLDVNTLLQISVNGGAWHGSAIYTSHQDGGLWSLAFNFKGDAARLKHVMLQQICHTSAFVHVDRRDSNYSSMLFPKATLGSSPDS